MVTFGDLKTSRLTSIASSCASSQQFADYCNEATERLMTRGNWWGTIQKIRVCVYSGCITWPRYVGTVLANNFCGVNKPVMGNWYEFSSLSGGEIRSRGGFGILGVTGFGWWPDGGIGAGAVVTQNSGFSPVFNPINCTQNYIRAYPRCQRDLGKTIKFFGTDGNGQTLMERDANDNWTDGITLTLVAPFASSSTTVRNIDRVVKDVTQCPVDCYQYDATNDVLLDLSHYDPQETSPSYAYSIIQNFNRGLVNNTSSAPQARQITALVKLAFQKVVNDTDLVLIDNIAALKLMIMAIKKEDAGDAEGANAYEVKAIHELNLQLRDKIPLDQVPVTVESFGTAIPARHGVGRIL